MESKRLVLAMALSVVFLGIYYMFFVPKPDPAAVSSRKNVIPAAAEQTSSPAEKDSDISELFKKQTAQKTVTAEPVQEVTADLKAEAAKEIVIETDLYKAVLMNKGAGLKSFVLKKYKADPIPAKLKQELPETDKVLNPENENQLDLVSSHADDYNYFPFYFSPFEGDELLVDLNQANFMVKSDGLIQLTGEDSTEIVFEYADSEKKIYVSKQFVFTNNSYVIGFSSKFIHNGNTITPPFIYGPDLENYVNPERGMFATMSVSYYDGQKVNSQTFSKLKTQKVADSSFQKARASLGSGHQWSAYHNTYFAAIFNTKSEVDYFLLKEVLGKNTSKQYAYILFRDAADIYLGPKAEQELERIEEIFPEASRTIDYGWSIFQIIAKVLLKGLKFVHHYIPNYGWALIIFTILVKLILFPLTYTSSVSMAKMQTLQPKLKAIKKKYKNLKDAEQRRLMNEETMKLYKQEKVNPASGCLPLLLQFPILIGFFQLLRATIDLRHEPWIFWVKDLSIKDPIFILPILVGLSQFVVSKMTPAGDPTQKKMMYLMPAMILVFSFSFPSGLNLYWMISNVLQIFQQKILNDKIYKEKKEEEKELRAQKRKKGGK